MEKIMMQKLLEAGVSADIVLKLHMEEAATEPEADPQPEPGPEPGPEPKPDPAPAPTADQKTDQVLAAIEKLTGIIQACARMRPHGITDLEVKSFMKKFGRQLYSLS